MKKKKEKKKETSKFGRSGLEDVGDGQQIAAELDLAAQQRRGHLVQLEAGRAAVELDQIIFNADQDGVVGVQQTRPAHGELLQAGEVVVLQRVRLPAKRFGFSTPTSFFFVCFGFFFFIPPNFFRLPHPLPFPTTKKKRNSQYLDGETVEQQVHAVGIEAETAAVGAGPEAQLVQRIFGHHHAVGTHLAHQRAQVRAQFAGVAAPLARAVEELGLLHQNSVH